MYLTGERVILRPLESGDYESYKEVRERCNDWLVPWEPTVDGVPSDTHSTYENYQYRIHSFDRGSQFDTSYGFGIFLHDGTFIGEVSLGTINRGPFQSVLLGYWVDMKYAGKGLVPEAASLVINYAFTNLGFRRIEIAIVPRNKSSIRVAEKLGFVYEGESKDYIEVAGVREDHARYSMTPSLWRQLNGDTQKESS
ncbi:MAG: GNAT family protein [Acidimicrobiia bacterium]